MEFRGKRECIAEERKIMKGRKHLPHLSPFSSSINPPQIHGTNTSILKFCLRKSHLTKIEKSKFKWRNNKKRHKSNFKGWRSLFTRKKVKMRKSNQQMNCFGASQIGGTIPVCCRTLIYLSSQKFHKLLELYRGLKLKTKI